MKYSGINLTKYLQDLCNENYKTFLKDIKEYLNKCKDIYHVHEFYVMMSILCKLIYTFNTIQVQTPETFSFRN